MSKKINKLPFMIGAAAFGAYRFYQGKGIFNKIRFAKQHTAVSKYLETHCPGAVYSDITETENGWSCIVSRENMRMAVYMTKSADGSFIFWENKI